MLPTAVRTDRQNDPLFSDFPPVSTAEWEEQLRRDLGEDARRQLVRRTLEGITLQPFYRNEDLEGLDHIEESLPPPSGTPAAASGWQIRQDFVISDAEAAQRRIEQALQEGVDGVGLHVHDPVTSPLQQPDDLRHVMAPVPLSSTAVHLRGKTQSLPLLALLHGVMQQQELDASAVSGTVDCDPLSELALHGHLQTEAAFREMEALLREARSRLPHLRVLAVDATPFHEAGAHAVQELAFAASALSEYLAYLTDRSHSVSDIARQVHLTFPIGRHLLKETAKLRAARHVLGQVFAAYDAPDVPPLYLHASSSRRSLTLFDPHTNLLRLTSAAAAGILGGADVVSVLPYDVLTRGEDDTEALPLARAVQLVLREEARLDKVADPLGGAYYIEVLTDRLGRAAWSLFQEIEAEGGHRQALRAGSLQQRIAETRETRRDHVNRGQDRLVGATWYANLGEARLPDAPPQAARSPAGQRRRFTRTPLAALNDYGKSSKPLAALFDAEAPASEPETPPLAPFRLASDFEALRLQVERHEQKHHARPSVFMLAHGPPAVRSGRARFARNLFGSAGFSIREHRDAAPLKESAEAAATSSPDIVVLCSTDDDYAEMACVVRRQLDRRGFEGLLLAVGEPQPTLLQAEVDGFVHPNINLLVTLRTYLQNLGVTG